MKGPVKVLLVVVAGAVAYGIYDGNANEDEYQMRALVSDAGDRVTCVKTEDVGGVDWMTCRYSEDVDHGPVWILAGEQDGRKRYVAANGHALSVVDTYNTLNDEQKARRPIVVKRDAEIDSRAPSMVPWSELN